MSQMTATPQRSFALERRHINPRCACLECAAFDESTTQPLQRLPHSSFKMHEELAPVMTVFDTETAEKCVYYFSEPISPHPSLTRGTAPSTRAASELHSNRGDHSLQTLVPFILAKIEKSIQKHPFLWFCISSLLG